MPMEFSTMNAGALCGKITAVIKSFSTIAYSLIHIRDAAPSYNLLQVDSNFSGIHG